MRSSSSRSSSDPPKPTLPAVLSAPPSPFALGWCIELALLRSAVVARVWITVPREVWWRSFRQPGRSYARATFK
jgi:hypothetical protein